MLSKMQKIWLGVFGAMFLIPEILFFNIVSYISVLFFSREMSTIALLFLKNNSLSPTIFLIILFIEIIGVLGLLIFCIKFNKKLFSVILGIISLWLLFIFLFINILSHMSIGW